MPPDAFWLALLAKVGATAGVVVLACGIAERAGPFLGGLIAALPVSAGPAYVLLALQADDRFIAASAIGSLVANAATGLFLIVYMRLAPHRSLPVSLAAALGAWLLAVSVAQQIAWSATAATLLNTVVYALCFRLAPPVDAGIRAVAPPRWFDIPLRALLVGLLVGGVVTTSRAIGPTATGIAALFPVVFTSLTAILHPRIGGMATAAVLASASRAMPGFGLALLVLHLAAVPFGRAPALVAFVLTCLVSPILLMTLRWRAKRVPAAEA